jgi:CheY-like chemotaxis protein
MNFLKALKSVSKKYKLLYVEDNETLRDKAKTLLGKFFDIVDTAADGKIALEMFHKTHYPLVITDIKMPQMDGLTLTQHIKDIKPETKVIIMSAFDDKELLFKGIELGIFRFLTKPVNINELTEILYSAIEEIEEENQKRVFYLHLKNIFNYQSSMVVMLHEKELVIANDMFLEFFGFESIAQSKKNFTAIGEKFLVHDGFLYKDEKRDVIETLVETPQKLFHAKLSSLDGSLKHFILKYQEIPEKKGYGILSFDDITELNLLGVFDENQSTPHNNTQGDSVLFNLLGVVQRNSAKVDMHNYYKGLSITNSASISKIEEDRLFLKTNYMQLKAMQLEQKTYIVSSALPSVVRASEVVKISFEKGEVELKLLSFVQTSPIERKTIRVTPTQKESISLFIDESKFHGEVIMEDISLDAVRVKLSALPAGLHSESEVRLDIVLELDKKPLIINTKAKMFKKSELQHSFSIVFMFVALKKNALVKYITKRQMELIREIKGMQNG